MVPIMVALNPSALPRLTMSRRDMVPVYDALISSLTGLGRYFFTGVILLGDNAVSRIAGTEPASRPYDEDADTPGFRNRPACASDEALNLELLLQVILPFGTRVKDCARCAYAKNRKITAVLGPLNGHERNCNLTCFYT
jgi:hypothetical protein